MATGCYQPKYLPASYKGISFKAEDVSSEHGRRGAEGEFPFSENTAYADLGRRIRRYTIRARFDGNDHIRDSQNLIFVCEQRGPGLLVHPTRGVVEAAACTRLTVSDQPETEQGVTYVDLELIEANSWPNGFQTIANLLNLGVSNLIGAASSWFLDTYFPAGAQPYWFNDIIRSATGQVANIASAYASATITSTVASVSTNITTGLTRALFRAPLMAKTVRTTPSSTIVTTTAVKVPSVSERRRAAILYDFDRVINNAYLAADPEIMEETLRLGMAALAKELNGRDKYDVFRGIANGAAKTSPLMPPASTSENAVYTYVRILAAVYMTEGALEADDLLVSDYYGMMDAIETILDEEMCNAREECASDLYLYLYQFRIETVAALYRKGYDAPGLLQFDFRGSVSPLVAAYSIYGDAKRLRELEHLNAIDYNGRIGRYVMAEK